MSAAQLRATNGRDARLLAVALALETARRLLDAYEPPALDPAIDETLQAFTRERKAMLPDKME